MLISRLTSLVGVGCLQFASVQAQTPVPTPAPSSKVVTDSRGNPKAIHVEFPIRSEAVVERAKLFYRQPGKAVYLEQELKLNRELLYAASIPYSETTEYFISVKLESGADFTVGSSANPQLLQSEDLPHIHEVRPGRLKRVAIAAALIVVVALGWILAEEIGGKEK